MNGFEILEWKNTFNEYFNAHKSIYGWVLIVFLYVDSAVCVCNFSVIYMKINMLLYYYIITTDLIMSTKTQ